MTTATLDPKDIARSVALMTAEADGQVGGFLTRIDGEDGVSDFRFEADVPGYEHWQWSITLFHNADDDSWTVDESTLLPGDDALLPPRWIPWKERLLPTDLSVTDSLGTDPDDERIEDGMSGEDLPDVAPEDAGDAPSSAQRDSDDAAATADAAGAVNDADGTPAAGSPDGDAAETPSPASAEPGAAETADGQDAEEPEAPATDALDIRDAIEAFDLSRRHVLSPLGRAQTAKRWYEGPHGPKSLSTKTASGVSCSDCGFFIPLTGELNRLFGVCANKWSPDDGKVVSLDHGCGQHSEIAPPEPTHLWRQTKPAFDDMRIDIIRHAPREESAAVELIEESVAAADESGDLPVEPVESVESVADMHADGNPEDAAPADAVEKTLQTDAVEDTDANDDAVPEAGESAGADEPVVESEDSADEDAQAADMPDDGTADAAGAEAEATIAVSVTASTEDMPVAGDSVAGEASEDAPVTSAESEAAPAEDARVPEPSSGEDSLLPLSGELSAEPTEG